MLRYAIVFGVPVGAVVIGSIIASLLLGGEQGGSVWVGYLIMLVALSVIFVAVRQYRDREQGGVIRFWTALGLGLAVAAVAGIVYVAVWEVYLVATDYAFIDAYASGIIDAKRAAGVSGAELEAEIEKMQALVDDYGKPWIRLPMTFTEIFPVGAIIALVSAFVLRRPGGPTG